MTKLSYGTKGKARAKCILEALLVYLENPQMVALRKLPQIRWDGTTLKLTDVKVSNILEIVKKWANQKESESIAIDNSSFIEPKVIIEGIDLLIASNVCSSINSGNTKQGYRSFECVLESKEKEKVLNFFEEKWKQLKQKSIPNSNVDNTEKTQSFKIPLEFQAKINYSTENFVGRQYVFNKISDFFQQNSSGYFIIEGPPGVGKTAILSQYIKNQELSCPCFFVDSAQGINRTKLFLQNISKQIIDKYDLKNITLPLRAYQDGNFFNYILMEASNKLPENERLIIAIDGLDEVDLNSQIPEANILYLPTTLPHNIFFIIAQRYPTKLRLETDFYRFDIMQYATESLQDIRYYIRYNTDEGTEVYEWVRDNNLSLEDFIERLANKAELNFRYLRNVIADLERGGYKDFDDIPQGLESYYESQWQRMKMSDKDQRLKINIAYFLSIYNEGISISQLSSLVKTSHFEINKIMDSWESLLYQKENKNGQYLYKFYHNNFSKFIVNQIGNQTDL